MTTTTKELIENYEKRVRKLKFKKVWTTEMLDEMDLIDEFIKDLKSLPEDNEGDVVERYKISKEVYQEFLHGNRSEIFNIFLDWLDEKLK